MACRAIYFLMNRNYRGDIENSVLDMFMGKS